MAIYRRALSAAEVLQHYRAGTNQLASPFTVATDLRGSVLGISPSVFVRLPFVVSDPAGLDTLTLHCSYDDGFVAFLNGLEVARRNAPNNTSWNTPALSERPIAEARRPEEISLSHALNALVPGENVLAIHALNARVDDDDLLISPTLEAVRLHRTEPRYFANPTPGSANSAIAYRGFVAATTVSHGRGFYNTNFSVAIDTATVNAVIRTTLDGSKPSETNGLIYTGPMLMTNTAILRASAFVPEYIPAPVDTHTYVFASNVVRQPVAPPGFPAQWAGFTADYAMDTNVVNNALYRESVITGLQSLPVLSVVMPVADLFGAQNGFYANSEQPWERETSVEFFDPVNGDQFQIDCGARISGATTIFHFMTPKHSLWLRFRGEYGATKLRFPLFPDSPVTSFDHLKVRTFSVDSWLQNEDASRLILRTNAQYARELWVKRTFLAMGQLAGHNRYTHVYLNGLYWGMYDITERHNADFVSSHLGGTAADWDVIDDGFVRDGDATAWNTALSLANGLNLANYTNYLRVLEYVNATNLADYMILHLYAGAEDWDTKNWTVARRRQPGAGFIFLPWDQEVILDDINRDFTERNSDGTPHRLWHRLNLSPEFRLLVADRLHKHLFNDGALTVSSNLARFRGLTAQIDTAVVAESARWGDHRRQPPYTRNVEWLAHLHYLTNHYFPRRHPIALAQFAADGFYPSLAAPVLSQNGGSVPEGYALTITHTNASGAILFTLDGSDPRLPGGAVSAAAQSYSEAIGLTANTTVRARVRSGTNWSSQVEATFYPPQDLSALQLTEIMYAPANSGSVDGDEFEFVELKNTGTRTLGLDGLAIAGGIGFTFTNGTRIQPGQFLVLVLNPVQFAARYPGVAFHGVYRGKLDNAGESIALAHPLGGRILGLAYDDAPPWPVTADGLGFSLVPVRTEGTANSNRAVHWRASSAPGGSPGADDPELNIPPVRINEVLTATDTPGGDFIELHNPTGTTADIGGWWLTDDGNTPAKFRIPDGTHIAPGGFVSFLETQFDPAPGTPGSFSLNAGGDELHLFSADNQTNLTGYSHSFAFGPAPRDVTFGRHVISTGEEHFPAQLASTRDAANAGPRVGPVVISEIQYHPDTDGDEFIELRNVTSSPVPLYDLEAATNIWKLSGLNYTFPPGLTLAPNGYLLLVTTNPEGFRAKYNIDAAVAILGPYPGLLQDSGERLELRRPDVPTTNGVNYITVDEVRYNDRAPWPAAADGSGPSLQRIVAATYGNDPIHWEAALPTPGAPFSPGDAPRIVTHPFSLTRVQYQSAELSVIATGAEPLFYQWRRNNTPLTGRTTPTLVLTNLQPGDAGDYKVDVFNTAGSVTSSNAALSVLIPAMITQQPLSRQMPPGGSVTFSVLAAGNGPLRYQWRFNDRELIGETNASLVISSVALVHDGLYQVLVTDAIGSAPSALARLTVLIRPVITEQPQSVTAVVGDTVHFRVAAAGNPLPFGYRWRRNGSTLTNFLLMATNSVLTLTNVQLANAATYSVIVTNLALSGSVSSNAVLTVLADTDGDRVPDSWEMAYGFNPNDPADGGLDPDGDTVNNRDEYISGTDPNDRLSYLKIETIGTAPGLSTLTFLATSNRTYSVLMRDRLGAGNWSVLSHLNVRPTNWTATVSDVSISVGERYYRLVAPEQR